APCSTSSVGDENGVGTRPGRPRGRSLPRDRVDRSGDSRAGGGPARPPRRGAGRAGPARGGLRMAVGRSGPDGAEAVLAVPPDLIPSPPVHIRTIRRYRLMSGIALASRAPTPSERPNQTIRRMACSFPVSYHESEARLRL